MNYWSSEYQAGPLSKLTNKTRTQNTPKNKMKATSQTTLAALCGLIAMIATAASSSATEIIRDLYFDGGTPPYTVGQSFAPDYSAAGTSWTVTSGSVNFFNGFAARPSLNGGAMSISFGTVAANTAATVSFRLGNIDGTTGSFRTSFALSDSTSGQSYVQFASPNADYYGTSGFSSYDNIGTLIAGASGAAIPASGWDVMEFSFDPNSGVTLKQSGTLVASWSNFSSLSKVDTFSFSVLDGAPFGIYDVTVDATLVPEPSTYALVLGGIATLFLIRRRRRSAC